ncbi:hypothetical protein C8R43DRAFT_984437 [Mycena crocata]|nr:hypothetical protein C8R43DRAFT_984437 [Mycena crocata]
MSTCPRNKRPQSCLNCGQPGHIIGICPHPPHCLVCGSDGHIMRVCPTRKCFNCGGSGHMASDCRHLQVAHVGAKATRLTRVRRLRTPSRLRVKTPLVRCYQFELTRTRTWTIVQSLKWTRIIKMMKVELTRTNQTLYRRTKINLTQTQTVAQRLRWKTLTN